MEEVEYTPEEQELFDEEEQEMFTECERNHLVPKITGEYLRIFTSDTFDGWFKYNSILTAEDVELEIKKLSVFLNNSEPYHSYLQNKVIIDCFKDKIIDKCNNLPSKSIERKTLELLLSDKCNEKAFNKNYTNSVIALIWLLMYVVYEMQFNLGKVAEALNDANLDNSSRKRVTLINSAVKDLENAKINEECLSDGDVQNGIDKANVLCNDDYTINNLIVLFELLNSRLIKQRHKDEILAFVKEKSDSSFSMKMQELYDYWKTTFFDEAMDCNFSIGQESNILREYTFTSSNSYRNKNSMCLNLTQNQITVLYTHLWHNGYIPDNVSAMDFGFALYGKPFERKLLNKIDWLKSKISFLTLFGELSNKEENQHYWCKLVDLFTWQGKDFTQKGLSAQYKKHINEPPKRKNKEVEEIKEIVALIKSIKE